MQIVCVHVCVSMRVPNCSYFSGYKIKPYALHQILAHLFAMILVRPPMPHSTGIGKGS